MPKLIPVGALALLVFPLAQTVAAAQETRLSDLAPYLMPRADEIALARTSAPNDLGKAASIWVLTRAGYEEVERGTNGFACFVGRGWSGPILVGPPNARRLHPDVFDEKLRAPHCFNALAARSVLPWQIARTRQLMAGVPAELVDARIDDEFKAGKLSLPEPGAMAYMTSPHQDLGPAFGPWRPHVMIYLPHLTNADWGIPGFTHDFPFVAEPGTPWSVAVVPMRAYSEGSHATEHVAGRKKP
jgi:hypothetical protein